MDEIPDWVWEKKRAYVTIHVRRYRNWILLGLLLVYFGLAYLGLNLRAH